MTKRVYLLRHAKSDWGSPSLPDHDRPLSGRGIKAAETIGKKLAEMSFSPDLVVCSTATRALETLEKVMQAGQFSWRIVYDENMYHASADRLMAFMRNQNIADQTILFVGHNPGIQDVSAALVKDNEAKARIRQKVPTGSFIGLEFEGKCFKDIKSGSAKLLQFMRPKYEFL